MTSHAGHRTSSRRRTALVGAAALLVSFMGGPTIAGTGAAHAEPLRKPRHSKIVPTNRAAPDITATIPKKAAPPKIAPVVPPPDDETLPPPFNLPTAPRSKMRACGEQWESVKMSGRAASRTWRDFATKCLAGSSEAARTNP